MNRRGFIKELVASGLGLFLTWAGVVKAKKKETMTLPLCHCVVAWDGESRSYYLDGNAVNYDEFMEKVWGVWEAPSVFDEDDWRRRRLKMESEWLSYSWQESSPWREDDDV